MTPEDVAMLDMAFRSKADECILTGRAALSSAYDAIQDMPLNKAALKRYTVTFDKQYFKACGVGVLANVIREMISGGFPDREIRAILLHIHPKLKAPLPVKVAAMDFSFVYLLECSGRHKIGITNDIPQRIRLLQTGAPFPVSLVNYTVIGLARINEKELHKHFAPKRRSGEWFELDSADIATFSSWSKHGIPTLTD